MFQTKKTAGAAFVALLLISLSLAADVKPSYYGAIASYSGPGKHPKNGQTGFVIDRATSGAHFVCFSYIILTKKKIKGRLSAEARVQTDGGSQFLHSFANLQVEAFDFAQGESVIDPCTGETIDIGLAFDFNVGYVSDCSFVTKTLSSGDVVRWKVDFSRLPRLTGDFSTYLVSAFVLPGLDSLTVLEARQFVLEQGIGALRNSSQRK